MGDSGCSNARCHASNKQGQKKEKHIVDEANVIAPPYSPVVMIRYFRFAMPVCLPVPCPFLRPRCTVPSLRIYLSRLVTSQQRLSGVSCPYFLVQVSNPSSAH
jgi:hypothetical protein